MPVPSPDEMESNVDTVTRKRELPVRHFMCDICAKSFTILPILKRHLSSHETTRVRCTHCNSCFTSADDIGEHMEIVHDYNKFVCSVCEAYFKNKYSLKKHMVVHADSPAKCRTCRVMFESQEAADQHFRKAHSMPHLCPICGKVYNLKSKYNVHMMVHSGEAFKYFCDFEGCGRKFSRLEVYEGHINTHKGLTPYFCEKCGRDFAVKNTFQKHQKSCLTPGRYKCNICPKKYSTASCLKNHCRATHEDKVFTCYCGKQFTYTSGLWKHQMEKHDK